MVVPWQWACSAHDVDVVVDVGQHQLCVRQLPPHASSLTSDSIAASGVVTLTGTNGINVVEYGWPTVGTPYTLMTGSSISGGTANLKAGTSNVGDYDVGSFSISCNTAVVANLVYDPTSGLAAAWGSGLRLLVSWAKTLGSSVVPGFGATANLLPATLGGQRQRGHRQHQPHGEGI